LSSGSEYVWKTVRTMLVQGPRRAVLLAGKLAATVVATLLIAVAAFVAGAAASFVIALVENGPLDPPPLGELIEGVAAAWLILAVGAAIGLAGGVIARGTGPVIGVGLVYLFVVELLLRNFAPSSDAISAIAEVLPGTSAGALAGALTDTDNGAPGVNDLVGSTRALVTLGAWLLASAVVAGLVFTRRDVHA
jgi:ABC-2 type transport system permease protein